MTKKIGIIVNPVAGMGGRVGLKGSDGPAILAQARRLGARPEAPQRAIRALEHLARLETPIDCITYPGVMGEQEALAAGLTPTVIGSIPAEGTTAEDTRRAASHMKALGLDLILFAGGDGTARDVMSVIGDRTPALGIPTGVKMHSAVFATSPANAGRLAAEYLAGTKRGLELREAEVMDIDETAFRNGRVSAQLYGYLRIPFARNMVQCRKAGSCAGQAETLAAIGADVVLGMAADQVYLVCTGTTTKAVMDHLGLPNTLLGVDAVLNKKLIGSDLNESQILELVGRQKAAIIAGVIGAQGYIFGRGNQQVSARVIETVGPENIIILAAMEKLLTLSGRPLLVDTGDPALDARLNGYIQVVTGLGQRTVYQVAC